MPERDILFLSFFFSFYEVIPEQKRSIVRSRPPLLAIPAYGCSFIFTAPLPSISQRFSSIFETYDRFFPFDDSRPIGN